MARSIEAAKGSRFILLAAICIVVAALYVAQEVLVPLALACLFCFLLAPLSIRLERWGITRVAAVLIVVGMTTAVVVALGWIVTRQVVSLAEQMPEYEGNIVRKYQNIHQRFFSGENIADKIEDLSQKMQDAATQPATQASTQPATSRATGSTEDQALRRPADSTARDTKGARAARDLPREVVGAPPSDQAPRGSTKDKPLWVTSVDSSSSWYSGVGSYLAFILSPLGTAGLVLVFVVFMLIGREDLRDRMIRLLGQGQLNITTQAIDDASTRISRYLMAQAIVNGTYALAVGIGLWLIGQFVGHKQFPTFVLWALLCGLLRFIPYIGPWIAAAFPIVLSLAVYDGFSVFFWTTGMFIFIELLSNNAMEPWLYGSSTGMSTVAVLVSAVFWTWLWGPVGLFLSTPLTVCLVVIGKYVPNLQFLDVLLGDQPVLLPAERVYQRLLAMDQDEAADVARGFIKDGSIDAVFDDALVPALAMAETDRHNGRLDEERAHFVRTAIRDIADDLADEARTAATLAEEPVLDVIKTATTNAVLAAKLLATKLPFGNQEKVTPPAAALPKGCIINIVCLPAHDEADEVVAFMLAKLLELRGYCAFSQSVTKLASEMMEAVVTHEADAVVVSAIPPGAVSYSRYLCKRLHARFAEMGMIVGLWTAKGDLKKAKERLTCIKTVQVCTTLTQAINEVTQLVQPIIVRKMEKGGTNGTAGVAAAPAQ